MVYHQNSLESFLEKKGSEYIDIDTKRVFNNYNKISNIFNLNKIIHVVGTNGKGSSCQMLCKVLTTLGYKIGLYTSPHILSFKERIKINNEELTDKILDDYHQEFNSYAYDNLSYFEYLTLIAGYIFSKEKCDFVIFEAGLGGEFDATNVFKKDISLITKIGLDHKDLLGDDIISISTTKLNSINKNAVIGIQDYDIVYDIAKSFNLQLTFVKDNINSKIDDLSLPKFLKDNLQAVLLVMKYFDITVEDLNTFNNFKVFGRFYKYRKNITIDVGHNELSAQAIKEELQDKKINLIFNTYSDKDYIKTLEVLKDNIESIYILPVENNNRIEDENRLRLAILMLKLNIIEKLEILDNKDYLVYGSFSVVEKFIKEF
jgi:dihydrofolate synthase/folylpolyglutamate synthase